MVVFNPDYSGAGIKALAVLRRSDDTYRTIQYLSEMSPSVRISRTIRL